MLIRARADAQANEIIRQSTSPAVIAFRTIQKWDGQLPVVTSGDRVPMLTMDLATIGSIPENERRTRLQELLGAPGPGGQHEQAPEAGQTPTGNEEPAQPAQPGNAPATP